MYHSVIIMVIVVKYFASIRDAIGKTSEQIEWQDKITAGDIWADVSKNIKYTGKVLSLIHI